MRRKILVPAAFMLIALQITSCGQHPPSAPTRGLPTANAKAQAVPAVSGASSAQTSPAYGSPHSGGRAQSETVGGLSRAWPPNNKPAPQPADRLITDAEVDKPVAPPDTLQARQNFLKQEYVQVPDTSTEVGDYRHVVENGFKDSVTEAVSTFSSDVDTGSYSNVRHLLTNGVMPPPDAVRPEEFINYFSYAYPEPQGQDPVSITTELSSCPWAPQHRLVRIGLKARSIDRDKLPASNLVFLIDVSGSMDSPERLPLIKKAFARLVDQLRPTDRVAIVTYAGEAGVALPSTPGNERDKILTTLESLSAGGSTDGSDGLVTAYDVATKNFIKAGNNRVILATDGDFNVGVTDDGELERLIEKERSTGVFLSCLGVGEDNLKDKKMEALADKGNGNYHYIDNTQEAEKVLVGQMGATLVTVAKDVKIQVAFNTTKVRQYRLVGYEKRVLDNADFDNDQKDAGDMGAGHTVTALYEIVPAVGPTSDAELMSVKVRYKQPDSNTSQLMVHSVPDQAVALDHSTPDFRFACSVAEFAMLLRDSPYKGVASYGQVVQLASQARGTDVDGCRAEFLRLTDTRAALQPSDTLVR